MLTFTSPTNPESFIPFAESRCKLWYVFERTTHFEIDLNDLKQVNKSLSNKNSIQDEKSGILEELCRYSASELHSVAAFIAGCCAQEAIKLITHQYVPIINILIYNGTQQSISLFKI